MTIFSFYDILFFVMAISKSSVISNFFWRFLERCGAQVVSLVVSIVLARLLEPSVYGTIALVTVFTTILQVFVDSGMGTALIQKKEADNIDFSTVFYFNLTTSLVLYLLIFLVAPYISVFYKLPELTLVIRVLSITIIIAAIRNVQQAYVSRNMIFRKFFYSTLVGIIGSAILGIYLAYAGFGIWALVWQNITNVALGTIVLWTTVNWRPTLNFSTTRLKGLFSFGWKLLVSALLDTVYNDLRTLIIGKIYTKEDLAFYERGKVFPCAIVSNLNSSIDSVLLPTMANAQDDKARVKAMTRRSISTSIYFAAPCMAGLAACAEPVIRLILTDKWLPCVFFLRIFCFTYCFWPIHTANLNAIKALGRSDLFLKLEIYKKIVGLIALFATVWISVKAMAYSLLITSILSQIINAWPNKSLLNYSYLDQLKDIFPSLFLATFMGSSVYSLNFLQIETIPLLCLQIIAGILIYVIGSKLLHIETFDYLITTITTFLKSRKSSQEVTQ